MIWLWWTVSVALAKHPVVPPPVPTPPVTAFAPPAPATSSAGSLWSEVAARQLMGLDGNARQVGDLVTVRIVESTSTNLQADTTSNRTSGASASVSALLGAESTITAAHPGMGGKIAIGGDTKTSFQGDGTTSRGEALQAILTCEVLEVLAGGNLHIWGYKTVKVNRETQYVVLDGVVRPRDIQMDNTVSSDLLAHADISITGSGVVADKQGPGFGTRLLDWLAPF